jgi:hypothetical protein
MIWSQLAVVGVVLGSTSLVACTAFSDTYITSSEAQQGSDGGEDGGASTMSAPTSATPGGSASTCAGAAFTKVDVSKLTACGGGKGHCYAKARVPMGDQLGACPDAADVCVPDEILTAGGDKLKSCKSIVGAGACVTGTLFPQLIAQGGSALGRDVCDASQLCVPCTDPRNGSATGMCDAIGVHGEDCAGAGGGTPAPAGDAGAGQPLPKCCTSNGHSNGVCIGEAAIPEANRSQTKQDTCTTGDKCVPAAFVSGTPTKCSSLLGAGVCMDKCFDDMLGLAGSIGILDGKGCATDTELCIPCSFVSGKGVPGCN